jgi:hypothetical protein
MDANLENTSLWPLTDWSALGRAADAVGKEVAPLELLIIKYQKALRICLISRFPWLQGEADRLITEFSEDRILREGWLKKPQSGRGRFRDYLKRSLINFVLDQYKKKDAVKHATPIDELDQEIIAPTQASASFELDWTKTLLTEALKRMEADCRQPGRDQPKRSHIWEIFEMRLLSPSLDGADVPSYEQAVSQLKLRSPNEASNMLLSAKRIFKRHLLAVITEYEGQGKAMAELEDLQRLLQRITGEK